MDQCGDPRIILSIVKILYCNICEIILLNSLMTIAHCNLLLQMITFVQSLFLTIFVLPRAMVLLLIWIVLLYLLYPNFLKTLFIRLGIVAIYSQQILVLMQQYTTKILIFQLYCLQQYWNLDFQNMLLQLRLPYQNQIFITNGHII